MRRGLAVAWEGRGEGGGGNIKDSELATHAAFGVLCVFGIFQV